MELQEMSETIDRAKTRIDELIAAVDKQFQARRAAEAAQRKAEKLALAYRETAERLMLELQEARAPSRFAIEPPPVWPSHDASLCNVNKVARRESASAPCEICGSGPCEVFISLPSLEERC